jgi:cytochrome c-type biogenesis protein CcmH/NrfG
VPRMRHLTIPLLMLALSGVPAVGAAPDPVAGLLTQARDAQTKGENELALRLAQSAIVADPTRPDSYVALGDFYAAQGQADYARNYYDEALSIDPMTPAALKGIAALQTQLQAQNQTKPAAPNTP